MRAVFKATIASPLLVGWYEPKILDERFYIRPTSLKGVWRWWARAFVGGVLYERGCLQGRDGRAALLEPTREEAAKISEIVGKTLGLGYAGSRDSAASKFRLVVKVVQQPNVGKVSRDQSVEINNKRLNLQRINLLTLDSKSRKRETEESHKKTLQYATGGSFDISVEYQGDPAVFNAAVGILAIALTLSGLGKGSRKGLGDLDVTSAQGFQPRAVKDLINQVRQQLQRLIRDDCRSKPRRLPPFPIVTEERWGDAPLAEIYSVSLPLDQLHNFFLRSSRARVVAGHYAAEDVLRSKLEAWVLGLPREQKDRKQKSTGYHFDGERRASTFIAAYHSNRHVFGGTSFLTVLISGDWPREMCWTNAKSQPIEINEGKVVEAYRDALNEFREYVGKRGGSIARVWP